MAGVIVKNMDSLDPNKPVINLIKGPFEGYTSINTGEIYNQKLVDTLRSDPNTNIAIWDSHEDYLRFTGKGG